MTIQALIVDDSKVNLDVLVQLLKLEGVVPFPVTYPSEIFAALDRMTQVDIVFLDLEFPNSDGFQLLQELKADPRLANIPIVAYTVHLSMENEVRAAGFHSFLGKPLDVEKFPEQLWRIMNGERVFSITH